MTHPSSLLLESYACGERTPGMSADVLAHIEECEACGAFVGELRGVVARGPSQKDADAAVARALARSRGREPVTASTAAPAPKPAPTRVGELERKRRLWMIATSVVTPLAAAAAILLLGIRTGPAPQPGSPSNQSTSDTPLGASAPAQPAPPDTIRMGTLPPRAEPDTRFKGGMQLAVVRERGGQQARFSSTVRVKPGDRLRVEVALDREQAILGAVLADDGSYLELMPEAVRGAGTYFSERSAKIDAAPTRGTIVIGSPEAVARARATKQLDGVATLRVEPEPAP